MLPSLPVCMLLFLAGMQHVVKSSHCSYLYQLRQNCCPVRRPYEVSYIDELTGVNVQYLALHGGPAPVHAWSSCDGGCC